MEAPHASVGNDIADSLPGFISATPSACDDAVRSIGTTILDSLTTTIPDSDMERLRSSAAIIQERISFCVSSHGDTLCNTNAPGAAPKRLLHIDKDSTTSFITCRLIDTPSPLPRYATLSYVWGPDQDNLCTVISNLKDMQASVPLDRLPLTVRHTVVLVSLLELEYLWVDALCIIQDCNEDKACEIANMAATYISAFLQVAAMASPGASHGLLPSLTSEHEEEVTMAEHHTIMKACRSLRQTDWDGVLLRHYPLLTRGWTFQERILARRCVHFTVKELVWECKSTRWCECSHIGPSMDSLALINNISAAFEVCTAHEIVPLWREFVMSFSRRNLGRKEDRLTAIAGIAERLPGTAEDYLAGLWRKAMPFELLWRCDQSQTARLEGRKTFRPSWSWGSVHCGVGWPAVPKARTVERPELGKGKSGSEKGLDYLVSGTYFERGVEGVEVVSAEVEAMGSRFGQVKKGVLELVARTVTVRVESRDHDWVEGDGDKTVWVIVGMDGAELPFYPDVVFGHDGFHEGAKDSEGDTYLFVEIASVKQDGKIWEAGLVVAKTPSESGEYERVGMAGHSVCETREGAEKWFAGLTPQPVRLV